MFSIEDIVLEKRIFSATKIIVYAAGYIKNVVEEMCVRGVIPSPVGEEDHFVVEVLSDKNDVVVYVCVFDSGA